ncbi:surfeit locus protein 4 [Capsaspora owczarzaki ATCC 30864]|uniref:Surfeit locus protein 4 n=1 Tax=Capsaspora owczarzaki (strain ATCC 30864) TaxID=595528 RepID=A0A0D2UQT1_CAPO3|nr:surfeit locus protein 4 [Capsaspora owczarzaki ATCC 30864]KJE97381.1 surfeit locus protein 4 [Capsaspora owczarzaki ATCC 30864]|eukprot:XP_004343111.1 surfeit locus protein 4 [Capsaspora owczarzaki ATCC 30864]
MYRGPGSAPAAGPSDFSSSVSSGPSITTPQSSHHSSSSSGGSSSNSSSNNNGLLGSFGRHPLIEQAEEVAEQALSKGKKYLPTIARLLLVSTFLEDGTRMWFQWGDQSDYFRRTWGVHWALVVLFLVLNMTAQIGGSLLIVARKHVRVAAGVLFGVIVAQTLAYSVLWNLSFFLRNLAMTGSLFLLIAEAQDSKPVYTAGLTVETDKERQHGYLLLVGRVLTVFMFFTLLHQPFGLLKILLIIVGSSLIALVVVGFRTKLSALLLVAFLGILNLFLNPFWTYKSWDTSRDFAKYDFFQTLSVMGALLMIVSIGPGMMSVDVRKKAY